MRSVVLAPNPGRAGYRVRVAELATPLAGPGELVVEMKACGLCGTDVEKINGEYTASSPVIGHEAVGVVHDVGEGVTGFAKGDRVFPHHHVPCYECYHCRTGSETMCDRYRSSNIVPGGFSEYFAVPKWNVEKGGVLKLPEGMGFEVGSLTEPVACCLRALARCKVMTDDSVLVAGAGPVGMMHALLLQEVGARVIISDVSEKRLRFAEKQGVGRVVNAKEDVAAKAKSETDGRGVDLALIATGNKDAILQGLRSVRKGGLVCLFGVPPRGSVLQYDVSELYNAERRLITSYAATESDTKAALRILSSNASDFGALVTHRFPLSDFEEAVRASASGEAMKVVLVP